MAVVFAIGAPIFLDRVQDDLEQRSVEVLNAAGVGPVSVHFSGQDGELRCLSGPVDIPADVVADIRSEWGVSSVDIAESCTTATDPSSGTGIDAGAVGNDGDGDGAGDGDDAADDAAEVSTTTAAPATTTSVVAQPDEDLDAVTDVVANDSQFSTLSGLLVDAGLDDVLAGEGPFTLFAPTNDAFEALGPDVIGELALDPDTLSQVLTHHATAGTFLAADLSTGELEMLDGTTVAVDVLDDAVVVESDGSSAAVTEPDLPAANGVVHAIDQVLIPEGVVFGVDPNTVIAAGEFIDGQITLTGTVATEAQRQLLVSAAQAGVDDANVIDELVVDNTVVIVSGAVDSLAETIAVLPSNLVSGTARLAPSGITVTGVYASDAERAAAEAALAAIDDGDVVAELSERAAASDDDAAALEADLNAFVAANPILFDPNSTEISAESAATIDRVAAIAARFGSVDIEIQGHTDTDGLPETNQALSEGRAAAVAEGLVERGLDGDTLTTVGFGGTEPILDSDGVEDKAASRRVEFVVVATQ